MGTSTVNCSQHGPQPETFVCQHIVQSLVDRKQVGFYWAKDPSTERPDAWCAACEKRVKKTGGEWIGDAQANLGVKLLCGRCYDLAKKLNFGG